MEPRVPRRHRTGFPGPTARIHERADAPHQGALPLATGHQRLWGDRIRLERRGWDRALDLGPNQCGSGLTRRIRGTHGMARSGQRNFRGRARVGSAAVDVAHGSSYSNTCRTARRAM